MSYQRPSFWQWRASSNKKNVSKCVSQIFCWLACFLRRLQFWMRVNCQSIAGGGRYSRYVVGMADLLKGKTGDWAMA